MRHSQLLHTSLSSFLMALIAVGAFGWACLIAVHAALNLTPAEVLKLVKSAGVLSVLTAGVTTGVVALLGPRVIRFILAKRGLIFLALAALALVDPLLAASTALACFLGLCIVRASYSDIGSNLKRILAFGDISFPWRVLFTVGGALILVGIATTPRLSLDLSLLLPWPVFSIYGLLAIAASSVVLGYVVGNICFPKIIHSTWAMLSIFCTILVLNTVVGAIFTAYGLVLLLVESRKTGHVYYVGDEIDPFRPLIMHNEAAKMIERSLTPCTPESEARGIYHSNNHIDP